MLRLERRSEKRSRSKTLGITLRSKNPFWTRELALAGGIAFFFHLGLGVLFSIGALHWESPSVLPSVAVSTERVMRPIDLSLVDPLLKSLEPPPRLVSPILPLEAEFPISLDGPKVFKTRAFIRGPYPQELSLPDIYPTIPENARISIRSDNHGRIFWFAWLEKTTSESLNHTLEVWLKTLTLLPENAFQATILEIQLSLHD